MRENPCTTLKSTPEKLSWFISTGRKSQWTWHTISASRVEVSEDCLSFYKADGTLAAFFDKSAVRSWREMYESELPTN